LADGGDESMSDSFSTGEEDDETSEHGIHVNELPEGWIRGGSQPGKYEMGLDENVYRSGSASAFIRLKEGAIFTPQASPSLGTRHPRTAEFGTICQNFYPKNFLNKNVKLSAYLCYELVANLDSWTGIWLKVEYTDETQSLGFRLDNMYDHKLTGSSNGNWVKCEIIHSIPASTVNVTFGFLLFGGGIVWADDFTFEPCK